jgi:hypothetical protein
MGIRLPGPGLSVRNVDDGCPPHRTPSIDNFPTELTSTNVHHGVTVMVIFMSSCREQ